MTWFVFNPVVTLAIIAVVALYIRGVRILAGRNRSVPTIQITCFFSGILCVALATLTPIDTVGEHSLVSVHMAQHLLIADIAGPLLLIGVRAPMLYFFWPAPLMKVVARRALLRSFWGFLTRPIVALSFWLTTLFIWHIPVLYETAITNSGTHALEHFIFSFGGILAWWPLLDPTHHRAEGRVWKAMYVVAARMIGGVLGIVLAVSQTQLYDMYGNRALTYGLTPLEDQQLAGAMMMIVDLFIMTIGFSVFIARTSEHEEPRIGVGDDVRPVNTTTAES